MDAFAFRIVSSKHSTVSWAVPLFVNYCTPDAKIAALGAAAFYIRNAGLGKGAAHSRRRDVT
jgi:hypothetical protein